MITALEIENFKAFGERQRIEFRPITLLFGPNSGGKSSVSHALHYLREVICEGNLDAHRTWSGGDALDLGGIRNFVHGRQTDKPIRLKVEFTLDGFDLPDYLSIPDWADEGKPTVSDDIRRQIQNATVELEIEPTQPPLLRAYRVALNDKPFAEILMKRESPFAEICNIQWLHPLLLISEEDRKIAEMYQQLANARAAVEWTLPSDQGEKREQLLEEIERVHRSSGPAGFMADLFDAAGGVPTWGAVLPIPRPVGEVLNFKDRLAVDLSHPEDSPRDSTAHTLSEKAEERLAQFRQEDSRRNSASQFVDLLSMLLLGPGAALRKSLRDLRYVGPLRAIPPRHPEPPDRSGRSRWPSGLQAWSELAFGSEDLLDEVSRCLEGEERLDTGYRLERQGLKQVPVRTIEMLGNPEYFDVVEELATEVGALPEQVRVMLRDVGRNVLLQPQDVGVGLSQVVPVAVALLSNLASLIVLEQPELHLHPRQQASLGDVVIRGSQALIGRVVLIETHSEHLILRLLRRIRETTRGQVVPAQALSPDQLRVQYVRREGSVSRVQIIDVDLNGDLVDPWPDDFFEQDFKERFS